jgi:signal transduction histidine kinase
MPKKISLFFKRLNDWCNKRVAASGAQYLTYGIFSVINHPTAYIYKIFADQTATDNLFLRLLATILPLGLVLKNKWPKKLKIWLPLYWYITITVTIPVFATYMILQNHLSLGWLMNTSLALLILILLVDWLMCIIITITGTSLGIISYVASGNPLILNVSNEYSALFFYMIIFTFILGTLFSRNREIFENYKLKAKDDLNLQLEEKVQERTKELNKTLGKLENALTLRKRVLNNLSHEVRTPIQGITSISDALVLNWKKYNTEQRFKYASMVAQNAKRLFSFVNNMLDMSRLDLGKINLDPEKEDFIKMVTNIINECNQLYMLEKKINLHFEHKNLGKAFIYADSHRITQVLRNLFANAIRYSKANTNVTATLQKSFIKDGLGNKQKAYLFKLVDESIGIPEDELEAIFEPFIESSRTRNMSGGTGLGLAICREIIKLHNGKIWAENNKNGMGSTFSFIIPVYQNIKKLEQAEENDLLEEPLNPIESVDSTNHNILHH